MIDTVTRARDRWREILPRLGIDTCFLRNKHGPCPLCGGKDRFRWDDRDGSGSYYCNQCGPGPGLLLIQKKRGWDFPTACREVDTIIGDREPLPRTSAPRTDYRASCLAACERILSEATDGDIVAGYLRRRGLSVVPPVLLGHPALSYMDGGRYVGRYPAMLAPIVGPDGALLSVHRTYLGDVPSRKKMMPVAGTIRGAAVRLFEHDEDLGVAEGIETAIAAHEIFSIPTWAVLSTAGMESFRPPAGPVRLIILADNDVNFAGQKSAYAMAHRLSREVDIRVEVRTPPTPGDWLDTLNQMEPAQ